MSFKSDAMPGATTVRPNVALVPSQGAPRSVKTGFENLQFKSITIEDSLFHLPHSSSRDSGDSVFERKGIGWQLNIICDISGHGSATDEYRERVETALEAALDQYFATNSCNHPPRPSEILMLAQRKVHAAFEAVQLDLFKDAVQESEANLAGKFVSLACVVFDLEGRTASYAIAGHEPILYYSAAKNTIAPLPNVGDDARPIFFDSFLKNEKFDEKTVPLTEGDVFGLRTDGITDLFEYQGLTMDVFLNIVAHYAEKNYSAPAIMQKVEGIIDVVGSGFKTLREIDDATLWILKVA